MSAAGKRSRTVIGTHSGTFHCDEALAVFMLLRTKQFANSDIVRTRDQKVLDDCDVVVDVGGVYDPARHRYDHHQLSFTGTFGPQYPIKLSSAGLIYFHFGREIIANEVGSSPEHTEIVFNRVYKHMIESIDAIDNGVDAYPPEMPPKYRVHSDLSSRISYLNPAWNDSKPNPDEQFRKASELAGTELIDRISYFGKVWLQARSLVEQALAARFSVHPSGEIVRMEQHCPWKDHLLDLEEESAARGEVISIKYVLFSEPAGWRVQCVSVNKTFKNRKSLLWQGLRDDELSRASGIPGGTFVHATGFIGGNKTYEGALAMAVASLAAPSVL